MRLLERQSRLLRLDSPQTFAMASAETVETARGIVASIEARLSATAATAAENEAIRSARSHLGDGVVQGPAGNSDGPDDPFTE